VVTHQLQVEHRTGKVAIGRLTFYRGAMPLSALMMMLLLLVDLEEAL